MLAAALLLAAMPAGCSGPAGATLCRSQAQPVSGGAYQVENNEWASDAAECISTDGNADFRVVRSAIANPTDGAPGGYPFIFKGCHWGACTSGSGLPVRVSRIRPGTVTTSWRTIQPGTGVYNAAYDIWFNQAPATGGHPDGAELMIWLASNGPNHPAGLRVATGLSIGGRGYDVWLIRRASWNAISYVMTRPATSVSHLDLHPLVADAVRRGSLRASWYLIGVEAGFELWQGGSGLATTSFSVHVAGGG